MVSAAEQDILGYIIKRCDFLLLVALYRGQITCPGYPMGSNEELSGHE